MLRGSRLRPRIRNNRTAVLVATTILVGAVLAAGCGASSGGKAKNAAATGGSGSSNSAIKTAAPDPGTKIGAGISLIPKSLQSYWGGWPVEGQGMTVKQNPYAHWTPPKPPWKFCYNQNYDGNGIRQAYVSTYAAEVHLLQQKGLASGPLVATNSNLNTALQIQQFQSLIQRGCNVIEYLSPSPTALCKVSKEAFQRGILAIGIEQPAPCPDAFSVGGDNDYLDSYYLAAWEAKALGGKGNVVLAPGIPSSPATRTNIAAAQAVFKQHPGIHIVGQVVTQWNNSVSRSAFGQFVTTHPQTINGVWQEGCCGDVSAASAFAQAGRPVPLINGYEGACYWLAYWKEHRLHSISYVEGAEAEQPWNWEIILRMLYGQKPVVNDLLHPAPLITDQSLNQWTKASWSPSSTCYAYPYDTRPVRRQWLGKLFHGRRQVPANLLAPVWSPSAPGAVKYTWNLSQEMQEQRSLLGG